MARYDQCDETCTTDCGHCKGRGLPEPTPEQAERLAARPSRRIEPPAEPGIF